MNFDLTKKEKNAISSLKRLAAKWPSTLWLFSASGTLRVMRAGKDGEQIHLKGGGVDPKFIVATISEIPNDGGDW